MKKQNQKGITLIALVITIIVLLILAGITINLTVGQNGILNRAQEAGKNYKESEVRENVELALLDLQTEVIFDNQDLTVEYALNKLEEKGVFEEIDIEEQTGITGGYVITLGYDENGNVIIVDMVPDGVVRIQAKVITKGYTKGPVEISVSVKTKGEAVTSLNIPEGMTKKEEGIYEVVSNGTYLIQAILGNGETVERELEITTIDNLAPKNFTITVAQVEAKIVIQGNTEDTEATQASACSGIEKYEYYVKKASDTDYPTIPYTTNEIEGLSYDTYNIYAKAYDKAGNITNSNEVSIEMVNPKVSKYGQKVNYSANGVDDWKIFYINEERNETFIITSGLLSNEQVPFDTTGLSINNKGGVHWKATAIPEYREIKESTRERFLMSWDENISSYSIRGVSVLLDEIAWDVFVSNGLKDYGVTAVGGPTIEMLVLSWNEKYPDKVMPSLKTNSQGYRFYDTDDGCGLSLIDKDELYFPSSSGNAWGYWLSSPSGRKTDNRFFCTAIYNVGTNVLRDRSCDAHNYESLRPVVCIPSNLLEYNSTTSSWDINLSK